MPPAASIRITETAEPGAVLIVSPADAIVDDLTSGASQVSPAGIPGGFLATYQDPGGATIYVMDQSTDSATQ